MHFGENLNHGIGSVGDLPIPFDTVLNISGLVIVLTFVFLKVSWKESIFIEKEVFINSKQPLFGKIFGWVLLSLLIVPGLISDENANTSIATINRMGIFLDRSSSNGAFLWRCICKI